MTNNKTNAASTSQLQRAPKPAPKLAAERSSDAAKTTSPDQYRPRRLLPPATPGTITPVLAPFTIPTAGIPPFAVPPVATPPAATPPAGIPPAAIPPAAIPPGTNCVDADPRYSTTKIASCF
ncbi:MAG: hypothetical protein DWH99_10005 [Planctomycetota bacterium]|nr:MAG: hypothetical protein DWH99_10005 [Planctomycetota bacterium]